MGHVLSIFRDLWDFIKECFFICFFNCFSGGHVSDDDGECDALFYQRPNDFDEEDDDYADLADLEDVFDVAESFPPYY